MNIENSKLIINLSMILSEPTGISNYAFNIFPALKSLEPTLLTASNYPDFKCHLIPANMTPADGKIGHLRRLLWTQFKLVQIYKKFKSQLLFSPISEAPVSDKCRFVVMSHDLIPLRFPKYFSLLRIYHRYYVPQVFTKAQHIICNSQATADDIMEYYGISGNKITPIALAYDSSHFRYFSLPTRNYFLYLGRQESYKNLHRLISAFAPLSQEYELWLAGPTDKRYTPILQMQVAELGISHRVKFLNYVDYQELPIIINQAIALVFPSLWEGFGFPVLEAMACGTPVITSNLSSLPEVAGDAAILVNPYNTAEITAAMGMIASDAQLRSQLQEQGLARANLFSWEKTGKATADVLSRYL